MSDYAALRFVLWYDFIIEISGALLVYSSGQEPPNDVSELQGIVADQYRQITHYQSQVSRYEYQIEYLKEQLRLAQALRFARSSEQYADPNDPQGLLFDESQLAQCTDEACGDEQNADPITQVAAHARNARGKRGPLPEYLERVRVEHTLPESELMGPQGEPFVKIGEEVSEQLDIIPAEVRVIQNVRFKYAVKGKEELGVKIAPLPGQPIPKSIATPGLLAHVATSKYCYHLPLYRQEQIWRSLDVNLPRNTLCRWMVQIGEAVQTLIDYQLAEMKQHRHIHVDETPVTVLDEKNKPPNKASHRGWMWVYANHLGVVYDYRPTRAGIHVREVLDEFQGYVQSDAYGGYDGLFTEGSGRTSVGCMAHARRKFVDVQKASAKKNQSPVAATVINLMAKLYHLESQAKKRGLSEQQVYQLRQEKAVPVLKQLHEYLRSKQGSVPPQSLLGKAIAYSLNHFEALKRYSEDGAINIDNNPAERAIKPFTVGRKNWLFCGNSKGAKAAANLLSLIESAKLYNLKPFDYLKYVLTHLPSATTPRQMERLLPLYAREHVPAMKK